MERSFKTLTPEETARALRMAYNLANNLFNYMDTTYGEDEPPADMLELGSQADSLIELIYG